MNDIKLETLRDVFVSLAEELGYSPEALDSAFENHPRRDAWEKANQMPVAGFASSLGISEDRARELIKRDFERMLPKVH
jgi:hypothetical protein